MLRIKISPSSKSKSSNSFIKKNDLYNSLNESILIFNEKGKIIDANSVSLKKFGFTKKELIGQSINNFITNQSKDVFYKISCIIKEKTYDRRKRINGWYKNQKGDYLLFKAVVKSGQHIRKKIIFVSLLDVTESYQAQLKQKESLSILKSIIEATNNGILIVSIEGDIVMYNRMFLKMWRIPKSYIENKNGDLLLEYLIPQVEKPKQFLDKIKELRKDRFAQSYDILRLKDGKIFERISKPQYIGENFVGRVLSFRDVTKEKHDTILQSALYKITNSSLSNENIIKFYEKIHKTIKKLMYAKNFYIAIYNKKTKELKYPYYIDEFDEPATSVNISNSLTEYIIKNNIPLLASPEKVEDLILERKIDPIGTPSVDWLGVPFVVNENVTGALVVQSYNTRIRYGEYDKKALTFISQHIANALGHKMNQENIKKYTKELEELNQNKNKLFSIISHDLRSPFQPLLGLSDMLANDIDSLEKEEIKEYANELNKIIRNQFNLLENLLNWSKLKSNTILFVPKSIELEKLLKKIVIRLNENLVKKNINVKYLMDKNIFVKADETMLASIIQNLISNAIKFSYKNSDIKIKAGKNGKLAIIKVIDSGIGINEEAVDNLFRLGSKFTSLGTEQEIGSGSGLILSKELVEKNNGKIWVEKNKDKGSTFTFTIPLAN